MKTRNSLVSNSSSSSFIVAFKDKRCPCCKVANNIFYNHIKNIGDGGFYSGEQTKLDYDGKSECLKMLHDEMTWAPDATSKLIEQIDNLSDDYIVISGSISYGDDQTKDLYNSLINDPDTIVLRELSG